MRPGERQALDSSTVDRSEVVSRVDQPYDTDVWVSFAQRISANQITTDWSVLGQFWAKEEAGEPARSPVFAQQVSYTGQFAIVTRSDANAVSTESSPNPVTRYTDNNFQRGMWHRFVYRLRFSRAATGELQGWRDGTEFLPTISIPVGYNDVVGPYWKFGCYRATGSAETAVVEYANVEVGTTSLAGRVTSPLPLPASAT